MEIKKLEYAAYTVKGSRNIVNQDRVLINEGILSGGGGTGITDASLLAIICDGVGSDERSNYAAEIVAKEFLNIDAEAAGPKQISSILRRINTRLIDIDGTCFNDNGSMSTTMAGLIINRDHILVFNVGDTRIYALDANECCLLTEDHVENIRRSAEPNAESAQMLTRWIGVDNEHWFPAMKEGRIKRGNSYFLICSDGFYNSAGVEYLQELLKTTDSYEAIQKTMKQKLETGTEDDASYILIKV